MAAVGRFLMILTLVATPWVFGSVQPWPQFLLGAMIGGLTLLRVLEVVSSRPDRAFHLPLASVAPLVVLLVATIQLLPQETTPAALMKHAVAAEDATLFEGPEHSASGTLSASSTRREAARLYLALAAFLLATQWFAEPSTHRMLLGALALNGAALGAFGIVQRLSWNGLLFWSVEMRFGGTPFASYVNRNNAAGYLNLCLGAAVGLAIITWGTNRIRGQPLSRFSDRIRHAVSRIDGLRMLTLSLLIVIVTAVLFSLSRGGIVAMAIGGIGVIATAFRGSDRRGLFVLSALILISAAGLLVFSGEFETVDERMDTLGNPLEAASGRLQHWSDTFGAVRDFPLLGTGFGTYRYANLPYQQHPSHAWYYNADNEWFELLVEVGAIGLAAILAGLMLIAISSLSLLRRKEEPQWLAIGAVGLFAVTSQFIQGLTDFGLIIPANGFTFAVLAGTVCGAACRATEFERLRLPRTLSLIRLDSQPGQVLLGGVLALAGLAFLLELYSATRADASRDHRIVLDPATTPLASIDTAIRQMEDALTLRPDDGELHQAIGDALAQRCRLEMYQQLVQESPTENARQQRQLWDSTSVSRLAVRTRQMAVGGQLEALDQIRQVPAIDNSLVAARNHYEQTLHHCPLNRGAAKWLARLSFLTTDITSSQNLGYLHKARFVAPSSPDDLLELAYLADASGQLQLAEQFWKRGLELAPGESSTVWRVAIQSRSPAKAVEAIMPADVNALVEVAAGTTAPLEREQLTNRAKSLLETNPGAASPLVKAQLAELQSQADVAIHNYRLALSDNPWDSKTRLKLARLLDRQGQLSEAVQEYSLLIRHLPNRKDILDELTALRLRERDETAGSNGPATSK